MGEGRRGGRGEADGFVAFSDAGAPARGEFRCSACGYGVAVATILPSCPMCGGTIWEPGPSTPLARAEARQER